MLPLRQVVAVDEDGLHAPARQDFAAYDETRPEQATRGDQPVTGRQQRAKGVNTAAMPLAVANAAGAPSIRRNRSSNILTVGLP